jgi:hypothetical protein
MNSRITGLRVAGTLFGIFCLAHLWRLIAGLDVVIGHRHIAPTLSVAAALLAGALSLWMFKLSAEQRG